MSRREGTWLSPLLLLASCLLLSGGRGGGGGVRAEITTGMEPNSAAQRNHFGLPIALITSQQRQQGPLQQHRRRTDGGSRRGQKRKGGGGGGERQCTAQRFEALATSIDDVEDLKLDVPANIAFEKRQRKRFLLYLNASTPLSIAFSHDVARKIYYNQTANLSRSLRADQSTIVLPCALRGQYDIFVQAKLRDSIKIEAHAAHPDAQWPLLNRTQRVNVRTQNRVQKRQMTVKWEKSRSDYHAVQYCLVVSTQRQQLDFCEAVYEYMSSLVARQGGSSCQAGAFMDYIWARPSQRLRKIAPHIATHVICTGSRTQQPLRGLVPNRTYYLDIFGVHTKRQNLTFHMASSRLHFERAHPSPLRLDAFSLVRLSGLHGVQVYSYKIPAMAALRLQREQLVGDGAELLREAQTSLQLRYLVIPCAGSEVNATVLRQRKNIGTVHNIYRPTYIKLPLVAPGERYIIRFKPTNEDEQLRANKVGLVVTTMPIFSEFPELPENITVFEGPTQCDSTTIAWHTAPETRHMRYCIYVFSLPQRNRSSIDYTNYCLDFASKRVKQQPHFYYTDCLSHAQSETTLQKYTILNLLPGESYLVYVTANLSDGRALPYQSLAITTKQSCQRPVEEDSRELNAYY